MDPSAMIFIAVVLIVLFGSFALTFGLTKKTKQGY